MIEELCAAQSATPGLMTTPPFFEDPKKRPFFKKITPFVLSRETISAGRLTVVVNQCRLSATVEEGCLSR
jgi:hypothetical protein